MTLDVTVRGAGEETARGIEVGTVEMDSSEWIPMGRGSQTETPWKRNLWQKRQEDASRNEKNNLQTEATMTQTSMLTAAKKKRKPGANCSGSEAKRRSRRSAEQKKRTEGKHEDEDHNGSIGRVARHDAGRTLRRLRGVR